MKRARNIAFAASVVVIMISILWAQDFPPQGGSGGGGGGSGDLLADGTVPLTANWDVGAFDITGEQFHSDIATGTAPFTVASTTAVANLNADLLDGEEATAFQDADADLAELAAVTTEAAGSIYYYDGVTWQHLPVGADNTVLTVDTATDDRIGWEAAAGGGGTPWIKWDALDGIAYPSTTTYCTLEVRNGHRMLAAGDSVEESVLFEGVMHEDYSGGTLTLDLHTTATASSGDAIWQVEWERMNTDLDSYSWASGKTVTVTANGTPGIITESAITFTQAEADGITAGGSFRLKVWRRGDDSADDMVGDAQLYRVTVRE